MAFLEGICENDEIAPIEKRDLYREIAINRFSRHSVIMALLWLTTFPQVSAQQTPNLLLFMADDMTFTDLGCYGNPDVKTPHIDRLATQGVRFTHCYNAAPTCSPLRQSLFTGMYPVRNGAHPNHSRVHEGVKSLPHYLTPLGYRVGIVGKRHEAPASAFPFEMLGGSHGDGGKTPDGTDLPLDKAREFISRDAQQPWCLVVTSNQPHTPWNRGDSSQYDPDALTVPPYLVDTPTLREAMSRYYAEITYMDGQVGTMLRHLEDFDLQQNTVVLWLSEQGSQLPFGKWTCYDTGIHAAAVLRWPGMVKSGSDSDALVSYVDIVPTFIEIAGGKATGMDGKSFAPLLRGETNRHNDVVFSVNTTRGIYHGSEAFGIRSATDGHWLYIRNLHSDNEFQNMVTHRDTVFTSWKTVETDFARQRVNSYVRRAPEELYDLANDPWCLSNLAATSLHRNQLTKLSAHMDVWMQQQGDLGDATERAAETRQPRQKPWSKNGEYARQAKK
ncbi:MAG: sulfatase [Fuerstiella sp.]